MPVNPCRYSSKRKPNTGDVDGNRDPHIVSNSSAGPDESPVYGIIHHQPSRRSTERDMSTGTIFADGEHQCFLSYRLMSGRSLTNGSRDIIKGKERTDTGLYPSTDVAKEGPRSGTLQTPERTETQASSKSIHPITSDSALPKQRDSDRKRPPRNRNLLESVHAHLTLRPRVNVALDTPSLLARLSDGIVDIPQSSAPVEPFNHKPSITEKDLLQNGISAPDIMGRTQNHITPPSVTSNGGEASLRLFTGEMEQTGSHPKRPVSDIDVSPERDRAPQAAKLRAQISQASAYISTHKVQHGSSTSGSSSAALCPPHESHCHVPSFHLKRGISVDDTITDTSHHPSMSSLGARTRLLAKLEEERNRATTEAVEKKISQKSSPLDKTFPMTVNQLSMSQDASDPNIVDTQLLEVKLRTRAQLQVRLAAEKKSTKT